MKLELTLAFFYRKKGQAPNSKTGESHVGGRYRGEGEFSRPLEKKRSQKLVPLEPETRSYMLACVTPNLKILTTRRGRKERNGKRLGGSLPSYTKRELRGGEREKTASCEVGQVEKETNHQTVRGAAERMGGESSRGKDARTA